MDKNTLIGFILIGAVLVGFSIYNRPSKEEIENAQRYQDSIQAVAQEQKEALLEAEAKKDSLALTTLQADSTSVFYDASQGTEQFYTLENKVLRVKLSNKGGQICEATLKDYNDQQGQPLVLFDKSDMSVAYALDGKNENIHTENLFFTPLNQTDSTLTMRLQAGANGYIDFNYHLLKDAYVVNLTIQANGMANFFPSSQKSMNIDWKLQL